MSKHPDVIEDIIEQLETVEKHNPALIKQAGIDVSDEAAMDGLLEHLISIAYEAGIDVEEYLESHLEGWD